MSINYKGEWGCHPLVVTLANTRELLYLWNRPGNRPSHERAYIFFDRSIDLCRRAGFRKILMKGDTDFSQSRHLDRWDQAWNLKCWLALSLKEIGRPKQKAKLKAEKHRLLRMDFSTFRQTMILIPTQIIRSARRQVFRLLAWSSSLETLFRLQDCLNLPLRT